MFKFTRQCTYTCKVRRFCVTIVVVVYSKCVSVALGIQHAMRLCRIIFSSVACRDVQYIPTLSHKRHDFRKEFLNTKCVFWFCLQLLSETFLILRRIQWQMIKNLHRSSYKLCVILVETWIFWTDFRKILKYQISRKSIQWEPSCSFRTDGQTWWI